ncbi:MAG: DUF2235 domain-containing protein [Novosphingobium sp.]
MNGLADNPRNLVVCCDGTSNEFVADRTNVAKLTYALVKDPARQQVFYHPGLGTMAAPGFPLPIGNRAARLAGLAFGYGIRDDIRDAYVWIMDHWRPGDRLYLFGFSRGSYTVRALAALIRLYGLAMPGNTALVPYAIRMLWQMGKDDASFSKNYSLSEEFEASLSGVNCRPHFVGVWDTVSSVGWAGSPVSLPHTRTNDEIAVFRHAIAIDERRAFFRTNLFQPKSGQDSVELWFPGDHCDVGGGHPETESGLSKYPLEWMVREAITAGLLIDEDRLDTILGRGGDGRFAAASPAAPLHESLTWPWRPCEIYPKPHWDNETGRRGRRCNLGRRRKMLSAPLVHAVAWDIPGYAERLPSDARRYER